MQRFIAEDPVRLSGGINYYSYTQNDPINFIDPTGLYWQLLQNLAYRIAPYIPAIAKFVTNWAEGQVKLPGGPSNYDAAKFVRDKLVPPEEKNPFELRPPPPGWVFDPISGLYIPPKGIVCVKPR